MALHLQITGEITKCTRDVFTAHLVNSPKEVSGIIEHDPWIASLADQLRDEISHAPVALREGLSVVVITFSLVLDHVLQMGNQFSAFAGWDCGLMHVQSTGEG
jgi:hypothetical protein